MEKERIKVGNLVIHSGSYCKYGIDCAPEWGIVLDIDGPQIDFGRRRSILIHWSPGGINESQDWEAPRDFYLVDEVINKKISFKFDDYFSQEERSEEHNEGPDSSQ